MRKSLFIAAIICLLLSAPAQWAAGAEAGKVTFNFVDVDLAAVTKFVSDITGKNFVFDERLRGKVTIIAPSKLSTEDAFSLFTTVLKLKGFTLVPSGIDVYKVLPASEAKQSGMEISTDGPPVNENYIARLIQLKYVSAEEALRFFQPIVSRDGHMSSFGPGNILFVVDSGLNIERIMSLLDSIDQPATTEDTELVLLKHASADSAARILNEGLSRPGRLAKAVADMRLNAVVIFGDKASKEAMKRLLELVDIPTAREQSSINVYFLENADADDIAKVIDGLMKGQPGRPPGSPSALEAISGVTITPHKATNSLVIVAPPAGYQNVVQVVRQLDRKRRQVYVEAMIVEASPSKLRELGTKIRGGGKIEDSVIVGGFGRIDQTSLLDLVGGLAGQMTVGAMGDFLSVPVSTPAGTTTLSVPGFAALFNLKEFRGAVNVLSTPQILTSDNTQAEIIVGENVPFISKIERGLTAGDQSPFSSIERRDVGITLRITPQITEGDYVKLEMYQEISSVKKPVVAIEETLLTTVGPTTTKRSTKTSVTVKDSRTVVIGGLMQEKQEVNVNKIPILGDIPILGWLFKSKSTSNEKTNLLVFLTPHIVKDAEGLSDITEEKQKQFGKKENQFKEGELLLKFKPDVPAERAGAVIKENEAAVLKVYEGLNIYLIKLKDGQSVGSGIKRFQSLPEVESAEPNYRIKAIQ